MRRREAQQATARTLDRGGPETGKSAVCAYVAQRLYPTDDAIAARMGDLIGHLRWLGGVRGEAAVDARLRDLLETPLLVLDDLDRAKRSHPPSPAMTLHESCASQDVVRLATLLRERHAAELPTVVTTRCLPAECPERTVAIARRDLVRGLVVTAAGRASPFEDFPSYSLSVLESTIRELRQGCTTHSLSRTQPIAAAA